LRENRAIAAGHDSAGGAIANLGKTIVTGVTFLANAAITSGGFGTNAQGGALWNDSAAAAHGGLTVKSSTITDNLVAATDDGTEQGGGLYQKSGAIHIDTHTVIKHNAPDDRYTA
jgi:hypothetical protein